MIIKTRFLRKRSRKPQILAYLGWIGNGSSRGAKRRGDLRFPGLIKSVVTVIFIAGLFLTGHALFCESHFESALESPQPEFASGGQEAEPPLKTQEAQTKAEPEKIVPGPRNIKERTAILVFLGWLWASIAVLIYILRLKIKETDRLYFARYYSPEKK